MKARRPKDVAASVRQRLLNLAHQRGDEFQIVLTHYAIERLLYRLSRSGHRDRFLLKGAMLMAVWTDRPYRPTRDLDLSARGDNSIPQVESVFREICGAPVEEDGLVFDQDSVRGELIRQDHEYEGVRLTLMARLGVAEVLLQVDIGFGDAVVPAAHQLTYPTLLGMPVPELKAYPRETAISEKLQAIVVLGAANSRMKDFYDIALLARLFDFGGATLCRAIHATFTRRRTTIPTDIPHGLSDAFIADAVKQKQWNAFVSRGRFLEKPATFGEAVVIVRDFVMPPMLAAATGEVFGETWTAGGPWR